MIPAIDQRAITDDVIKLENITNRLVARINHIEGSCGIDAGVLGGVVKVMGYELFNTLTTAEFFGHRPNPQAEAVILISSAQRLLAIAKDLVVPGALPLGKNESEVSS